MAQPPDRPRTSSIAGLGVLAFLLMLSYSIARPTTEGMFLKAYGHAGLPVVWILVTVAVVLVVAIYNHFVDRVELMTLYGTASLISAVVGAGLLVGLRFGLAGSHHLLYLWKDLYVVLLVEIFYSHANSVFAIPTARWIYGLFGGLGAVGGLIGSITVGALAERVGTTGLLWAVPGILALIWLLCLPLGRVAGSPAPGSSAPRSSLAGAIRIVARSRYLTLVLILIAVVQVAITLVDFEFNAVVERTFLSEEQASAAIATVYGAIDAVTLGLHAMTGPVLRLIGVPLTLVMIPVLLAAGLSVYVAIPLFSTVAVVKATSKCLDYSIFRAAKEMLYIPLSFAERTQGKSMVDIATYRVAKGGASLLLLGAVMLGAAAMVPPLTLLLIVLWLLATWVIVRRFRALVSHDEEIRSTCRTPLPPT